MVLLFSAACIGVPSASGQLFDNLRALGGLRYSVGDPSVTSTNLEGEPIDGPKDIAVADLDGDGFGDFAVPDKDGSVTVYYGVGNGTFTNVLHLRTWTNEPADLRTLSSTNYSTNVVCDLQPTNSVVRCFTNTPPPPPPGLPPSTATNVVCFTNLEYGCVGFITNVTADVTSLGGPFGLRGVALADWTSDGRRDIAVASPGESVIYFFTNLGSRQFSAPAQIPAWFGVRDLATGDFDGDGQVDLAAGGTTNGVVQFRSLGDGTFVSVTAILELASDAFEDDEDDPDFDFPQPAYYLKAVRHPGDVQHELIASFAQRRRISILRADGSGRLMIVGQITNVSLTALDAAPLLRPATNGAPLDLVTAYSRGGCVDIFAAASGPRRFDSQPVQRLFVPGGPRNIRIADVDQDGWNDLVVVAQRSNRALIYKNNHGQFELVSEALTGRFPREMDLGDFNSDGRPDMAVVNRNSFDVSILITATNLEPGIPVGFLALDSVYPVDGGVSGLSLQDFNSDGRPDVMQLHRDSGEFSVRLTEADGRLGAPAYYAITNAFQPAAQITADVNGDDRPDLVSANLSGSVTVRLGEADGTFGPPETFFLPAEAAGSLFALVPGDFDGDGRIDLAAGYLDCRVSFFRGDGTGRFAHTRTHLFIFEPRSMAAADLDQDGDLDLVGGSWMEVFVVVENEGNLLDTPALQKVEYGEAKKSGAALRLVDQNEDGDPDILLGSPGGFALWLGGPGLSFTHFPVDNSNNDPSIFGSVFVSADLDGDSDSDIAMVCSSNVCLTIQAFVEGQYVTVLSVPVPETRYLAAADLDGDGFMDLVGSGEVLWVALSSRAASAVAPAELLASRQNGGVVINEILPQNTNLPLMGDGDRTSDWVELYNGGSQAVPLAGWQLCLVRTNIVTLMATNFAGGSTIVTSNSVEVLTNVFVFPSDSPMEPGAHLLLICADRLRTSYHTGFNLPGEGGLLCLINAEGQEVDRVAYPEVGENLAYARYADGARAFVANNIPSPGAPNVDNGAVDPVLTFDGIDLETLRVPGGPLRFRASARDDVGIVNVSVLWRRLDIADATTRRAILFDDGMNEDGALNDGAFSGSLGEALPPGAEIQFYLECTDLSDLVITKPGNPRFGGPGQLPQTYAVAVGVPVPPLEISEIVADNESGIRDEGGGTADWIEIRNFSGANVSLAGIGISQRLFGNSDRMTFDNRPSIGPGEHLIVFADGNTDQGLLHAPFGLDRMGEQLWLTGTTANGGRFVIDALNYGPQATDTALARLGRGGPWLALPATPRAGNVAEPWRAAIMGESFLLAYPTRAGRTYRIEYKDDVSGDWTTLSSEQSVGLEQRVIEPMQASRFYRVVEE